MVKSTTVKALALITFVSFLGLIALHQSLKFSAFSNAGKYLRKAVLADEPVEATPNGGFGNGYAEPDNNGVTEFQQEEDDEDRDVKGENDKEEEEEEDDDDDDREEESDHDAEDREDEEGDEENDEDDDEEDDNDGKDDEKDDDDEDDEEDDNDGKDDEKDDDDEDDKQEPKEEPVLPKRKRLPKALIIGFSKCGTTALRTFLALHPDIVSPIEEVRYFNYNYSKGLEWYRNQMPPSTEKQITIEKTPSYIMSPLVLQRIYQYNPKIKLIIIIRDPIIRLQSQFAHTFRNAPPNAHIPDFKNWCKGDTTDKRIIHFVGYTTYIRQVYDQFAREQVLVLAEEDFEQNPLSVMKEVEVFLGLKPAFNKDMFYFNRSKGFYCFNRENEFFPTVLRMVKVNNRTGCLGEDKGRDHPEISPEFQKELVQYVRPHNEQLFKLIGKRIIWENFE